MRWHALSAGEWLKAVGVGIAVSVLTAVIMMIALRTGASPLPKPLGLAFAETLLARPLPVPVGALFHTVWTTAFSVLYIALFREALTFMRAFWLAFALWVLVLLVFFPIVGWGFFGLGIGPQLIVAAAAPHLLFALFVWGLSRWAFRN
jgi:hypothetical protein